MMAVTRRKPFTKKLSDSTLFLQRTINTNELLTPEIEMDLGLRSQKGDVEAREKLINSHIRLVFKVAAHYQRIQPHNYDEMISVGVEGLAKAARKFDPTAARFATYATFWIKAELRNFVSTNAAPVYLGNSNKVMLSLHKLRAAREKAGISGTTTLLPQATRDEITALTRISIGVMKELEQQLANTGEQYFCGVSLNSPGKENGMGESRSLEEALEDTRPNQEEMVSEQQMQTMYQNIVASLPEKMGMSDRDRHIFEHRIMATDATHETLDTVGVKFGITRERVRQIEQRLLGQIRDYISKTYKHQTLFPGADKRKEKLC
jgi:RNA polymerase sigma-32 factor